MDEQSKNHKKSKKRFSLHNQKYFFYYKRFLLTFLSSLILHVLLFIFFLYQPNSIQKPREKKEHIKISLFSKPKDKKKKKPDPLSKAHKIVESKLEKTKAPKKTSYLGRQDHIAKKEQKANKKFKPTIIATPSKPKPSPVKKPVNKHKKYRKNNMGSLAILKKKTKEKPLQKKNYKDFIKASISNLEKNYFIPSSTDYIDDDNLAEGERIDISTRNYRYIGYFSKLRRAIELAWRYPLEAARKGQEGKVLVGFVINKNGNISDLKILTSSGFALLDESVLTAIKIATPFSPLPESFKKKRLPISGAFNYILGFFSNPY
jgi:periplasmic protein TonB